MKSARGSTRVAADSFDRRSGNGQGNGPASSQPLAFEAQKYATVLNRAAPKPAEGRNTKKLELSLAISGVIHSTSAIVSTLYSVAITCVLRTADSQHAGSTN